MARRVDVGSPSEWLSLHANLARQVAMLEREKARVTNSSGSKHHALRDLQVELSELRDE